MVNARVNVNRGLDGKFKKLEEMVDDFQKFYLNGMADQIVINSPVDTGTYMDSHHVSSSPVSGSNSSKNQTRGQDWDIHAKMAIKRMSDEISKLLNSTVVYFGNASEHADAVEYEWGYEVYSKARRKHKSIAERAEQLAKGVNR